MADSEITPWINGADAAFPDPETAERLRREALTSRPVAHRAALDWLTRLDPADGRTEYEISPLPPEVAARMHQLALDAIAGERRLEVVAQVTTRSFAAMTARLVASMAGAALTGRLSPAQAEAWSQLAALAPPGRGYPPTEGDYADAFEVALELAPVERGKDGT